MKDTRSCIIGFALLVVFQLFVLDNLHVNGLYNPYVYVWFILCLPYQLNPSLLVLISFATGLTIDLFSGTAGMHALACTVTGYMRYLLLRGNVKSERERGWAPMLSRTGFWWYFRYTATLVIVHHLSLFMVESWTLNDFQTVLIRALCSSALTLAMIFACEIFFAEKS